MVQLLVVGLALPQLLLAPLPLLLLGAKESVLQASRRAVVEEEEEDEVRGCSRRSLQRLEEGEEAVVVVVVAALVVEADEEEEEEVVVVVVVRVGQEGAADAQVALGVRRLPLPRRVLLQVVRRAAARQLRPHLRQPRKAQSAVVQCTRREDGRCQGPGKKTNPPPTRIEAVVVVVVFGVEEDEAAPRRA